jgi:hypothetical protein
METDKTEIQTQEEIKNQEIEIEKELLIKKEVAKKDFKELSERLKIRIEKEKFETVSNVKRIYIISAIILLIVLVINIAIWTFKVPLVFKILSGIISVPLLFALLVFIIIRLWLFGDFRTLKGNIVLKVTANYIIANFFLTQKRIVKRICLIEPDGITFLYGTGIYNVDYSCVYLDEENRPNSFYVPNLPNPLRLDFMKYLKLALDSFRHSDVENFNEDLDVIYSAENLKLFKKDKFLEEFHRDNSEALNKMIMYIIAIAVISMIAIVIIVIVLNKNPNITVVANLTSTARPNF